MKLTRGSPGRDVGHWTSPILRDPSGGIETVMAAYETSAARSPLNISPGSFVERCRVVAAKIGTSEVPSTVAVGISTPCEGRLAQAPRTNAIEIADSVNIRLVLRTEIYSHSYSVPKRAHEKEVLRKRPPILHTPRDDHLILVRRARSKSRQRLL